MSSQSGSTADGGDATDRPRREVAYRLFAAEFDDASLSYSESDEERAPNYVVTPSGARVNRLFAVGVLTEVERVNDDVLRGRVVDPTGAFVSYAGQYQPDEMAFLDRASPPAFVALSGKARTFQPEDSDRVFTSVRPESLSRVDADTRDRWTVTTAEATLERVGVMAAALESGLTGSDLQRALQTAGVDAPLAAGVPRALDHYGTTPAYLAALSRLATDALEVVAGDREEVRALERAPGEVGGDVDLDALAADLDLAAPTASTDAEAADPDAAATTADSAGTDSAATDSGTMTADDAAETEPPVTAEPTASTSTADEPEPTEATPADTDASVDAATATETAESTTPAPAGSSEATDAGPSVDSAIESDPAPVESAAETDVGSPIETDADSSADSGDSLGQDETTAASSSSQSTDSPSAADDGPGDFETPSPDDAAPSTGAADDELGDFDAGGSGASDAPGTERADDSAGEPASDADGMYELDEAEREEIEAEFGTEFSTGSEVGPAGEADIDVPSVDELEEELDEDLGSEPDANDAPTATSTAADEPATDAGTPEPDAAEEGTAEATDTGTAETTDAATDADVDLEAAAVEAMTALDDGDGATREAVVARVVDQYGADPGDVEDAIQSALMSGQCYEPTEDSLKAI
jgi:RPA family protein